MTKGYTSIKKKFHLRFWDKTYVLGWAYFWKYNVIDRILLRAIEMTYKGLHFRKGQWNFGKGQAWGKTNMHLRNNL